MATVPCCRIAFDVLDDQKAVRAEILKIRFADTIIKANVYLTGVGVGTNLKAKDGALVRSNVKEKEKKARLQTKIKTEAKNRLKKLPKSRETARRAFEEMETRVVKEKERKVMLQTNVKTEAKNRLKTLQKRREAARRALEEMEKRVVVEDNFKVMQELNSFVGSESRKIFNAVGLHLKREEEVEEE